MAAFIVQLRHVALRPWLDIFKMSSALLPGCLDRMHRNHLEAAAEFMLTSRRLSSAASSGRSGLFSKVPEQLSPRSLRSSSHLSAQGSAKIPSAGATRGKNMLSLRLAFVCLGFKTVHLSILIQNQCLTASQVTMSCSGVDHEEEGRGQVAFVL